MKSETNNGGASGGERAGLDGASTADGSAAIKMEKLDKKKAASDEAFGPDLGRPAFPSMAEPSTCQVGHYIFLRCGHNGNFLDVERKVYERHLIRAGIITKEDHNNRLSDQSALFGDSAASHRRLTLA